MCIACVSNEFSHASCVLKLKCFGVLSRVWCVCVCMFVCVLNVLACFGVFGVFHSSRHQLFPSTFHHVATVHYVSSSFHHCFVNGSSTSHQLLIAVESLFNFDAIVFQILCALYVSPMSPCTRPAF